MLVLCSHLKDPLSCFDLAWSWVLNSAQLDGAVFVTRSKRDLQSVAAMASGRDASGIDCSFAISEAIAAGRFCKDSWGFFQLILLSLSQAQNRRIQDIWSRVESRAIVSADNVLVTTFYIFLLLHEMGLTGQVLLDSMSQCLCGWLRWSCPHENLAPFEKQMRHQRMLGKNVLWWYRLNLNGYFMVLLRFMESLACLNQSSYRCGIHCWLKLGQLAW